MTLKKSTLDDYLKAGRIASKTVSLLKKAIKADSPLLEIAELAESKIRELGGGFAFPINLSKNDIAAHYTPVTGDRTTVGESVLKVDLGVHANGWIADTAFTLDFTGKYSDMLKAAEQALKKAIKMCTPGTNVSEIGKAIEETINSFGYRPISNLSGHSLGQYNLHAGTTIPNINSGDEELKPGMVVAIEPFATDGDGKVTDAPDSVIFRWLERKPVRSREAKMILDTAEKKFNKLPFASRWIKMPPLRMKLALNQLLMAKALYSYPILIERRNGKISQFEHTVIVGDKPKVTTC